MRVLELFAGLGACSKALDRLGIEFEIVDAVEIDKFAIRSFNAIHGTNFEPQDISKWNKDIEVDLITHGSPCQDISKAGFQKGADEDSGTRSSLMYETLRIVEKLKPKYVIWENVKNLLNKKHIHNFNNYLERMDQLGYTNYYQVLNAKDYNVCQNRERIFVVSIRKDINKSFVFPSKQKLKRTLRSYLKPAAYEEIKEKYKEFGNFIIFNRKTDNELINGIYNRVWKIDKYVGTIPARHNVLKIGEIIDNKLHYRLLQTEEAFMLMGFDKQDYEAAISVNSPSIVYRQAGNSIVVNVMVAIFKNLLLDNQFVPEGQMTIYDYIKSNE